VIVGLAPDLYFVTQFQNRQLILQLCGESAVSAELADRKSVAKKKVKKKSSEKNVGEKDLKKLADVSTAAEASCSDDGYRSVNVSVTFRRFEGVLQLKNFFGGAGTFSLLLATQPMQTKILGTTALLR
jgi:hypothetical protein